MPVGVNGGIRMAATSGGSGSSSTATVGGSPAKIYTGSPPPGTPIPPGTQIILSEGVSGGVTKLSLSPVAAPGAEFYVSYAECNTGRERAKLSCHNYELALYFYDRFFWVMNLYLFNSVSID